jgi:two-component system, NtrC family, nitrogen regulation response regulator NtrX
MPNILIVDDERAVRSTLKDILEMEGYTVVDAANGEEALKFLGEKDFDVILSDIKMPRVDGMELLEKAIAMGVNAPFIMLSAHGTIDTAVEATKMGAYDFLQKPPDLGRLLVSVRNAGKHNALAKEASQLKVKLERSTEMIGQGPAMLDLKDVIAKVAPTEARVLITGPNGSGKELVAKAIHNHSSRAKGPMIVVNCAAIPGELIESDLFGHEKGSFTSAHRQQIGKFEQANDGTLFLDEIGDMSLSAQAKVLRALQERKITRIGGDEEISVNVRVLAATNKDLQFEISQGRFREDLYHRISVIVIKVPPLAERKEDIPALIDFFLKSYAAENGLPLAKITPKAISYLQTLPWTGNVRELKNVTERLLIMCGDLISDLDAKKYANP